MDSVASSEHFDNADFILHGLHHLVVLYGQSNVSQACLASMKKQSFWSKEMKIAAGIVAGLSCLGAIGGAIKVGAEFINLPDRVQKLEHHQWQILRRMGLSLEDIEPAAKK